MLLSSNHDPDIPMSVAALSADPDASRAAMQCCGRNTTVEEAEFLETGGFKGLMPLQSVALAPAILQNETRKGPFECLHQT